MCPLSVSGVFSKYFLIVFIDIPCHVLRYIFLTACIMVESQLVLNPLRTADPKLGFCNRPITVHIVLRNITSSTYINYFFINDINTIEKTES